MTGDAIMGTKIPLRAFTFLVRPGPDGVQRVYIEVIGRNPNSNTGSGAGGN
jgi:hypothetical protein